MDALARRLHDHAIDDALHGHLAAREVVAVMGGHTLQKTATNTTPHQPQALTLPSFGGAR